MNVAPENLDGWKGDLDPYDEWEYKNGSRVPYTSVCSVLGIDYDNPNQPITLTLNNPINLGDRGQATLSTIWEKVYPAPSWACRPYFNCPYSAPWCTANFTWDPKLPVVYLKNFTSPTGVENPNIVCLWYENRTSLLSAFLQATLNKQQHPQCLPIASTLHHLTSLCLQQRPPSSRRTDNTNAACMSQRRPCYPCRSIRTTTVGAISTLGLGPPSPGGGLTLSLPPLSDEPSLLSSRRTAPTP